MKQQHFDSSELDREDAELERIASRLEIDAWDVDDTPPPGLAGRVMAAVEAEPTPVGWRTRLGAWLGVGRGAGRVLAATGVAAVAVVAAIAFATFSQAARDRVGASPSPSVEVVVPSVVESPTVSPSPSATPSPSPSPSVVPTVRPTAVPTPSSEAPETPEASPDDDDFETPKPDETDDDHSGPGGGGDD